jgi:hypothetical protein
MAKERTNRMSLWSFAVTDCGRYAGPAAAVPPVAPRPALPERRRLERRHAAAYETPLFDHNQNPVNGVLRARRGGRNSPATFLA